MEFFGKDLGLLCFTDFEKAPKTRFRWTSHDIMKRFQSSIDQEMWCLSKVGALFQDYIINGIEPPKF